jgi:hypothetical protein
VKAVHDKRLLRCIRRLSDRELMAVHAAMHGTAAAFGRPHIHAGTGVQRLRENLFECRAGLGLRLLFERHSDELLFVFAGNHGEVRAFLRNRF